MPRRHAIPLSSIPEIIQIGIAEKLDYHDNYNFQMASKLSNFISNLIRKRITISPLPFARDGITPTMGSLTVEFTDCGIFYLSVFYLRESRNAWFTVDPSQIKNIRFDAPLLTIRNELNEANCLRLMSFLEETQSTVLYLNCYETFINCSLTTFNRLLETSRASGFYDSKNLISDDYLSDYLQMPALKMMKQLHFTGRAMTNQELLQFKAEDIRVIHSQIDNIGLNQFLKEFVFGKRRIDTFSIRLNEAPNARVFLAGIPHIEEKRRINGYYRTFFTIQCRGIEVEIENDYYEEVFGQALIDGREKTVN